MYFGFSYFFAQDYIYLFSLLYNDTAVVLIAVAVTCLFIAHLGCLEFVVIRNNISVNILVCASWHAQACIYIGRIPCSEAADSQEMDISNSVR